jgi:hypothetical protein
MNMELQLLAEGNQMHIQSLLRIFRPTEGEITGGWRAA